MQKANLTELYKCVSKHFGGQDKAAEALGISQSSVGDWCRGKTRMSPVSAAKVQKQTNGQFLAINLCPELKQVFEILEI
jgi:transcriptional repressor of cell division inhibition gene dicB